MITITKKEVESLLNPNITVKRYHEIITKIDTKFDEICAKLLVKISPSRSWYDYDTVNYDAENPIGFFDPVCYKEFIFIDGEHIYSKTDDMKFPTKWLWEKNWEKELEKNIEQFHNKKYGKIKKNIEYKNKLVKSIKNKLTKEELKLILFK